MTSSTGTPAFTLEQVAVRRGGRALLSAVTCRIPEAACTAVVGPSGAGKSTLLRVLNRLEEPTRGTVAYRGRPLTGWDGPALRRQVILVGQRPVLLTGTVRDELRVGRRELDGARLTALLERVRLPAGYLDRATATLSGGEAQRVCLARALAVGPRVLLLDEPTSALDATVTAAVERLVRDLAADGLTLVLVSHDTEQARRLSDLVLVLRDGRLVERGPARRVDYLEEDG
ncbi:ATP-binding cassette domain-containing protein [Streptomyces sp. CRN 30]|uniref:ABC transporter ATP-binding protein n=1 Tax=Streptomyces sp. CRN 30 TaxID=3075613 RepID=UPI002A7EBE21|nr:ATP-binding cassette domain-containing protein [Streptomyces sp. CRN 30]